MSVEIESNFLLWRLGIFRCGSGSCRHSARSGSMIFDFKSFSKTRSSGRGRIYRWWRWWWNVNVFWDNFSLSHGHISSHVIPGFTSGRCFFWLNIPHDITCLNKEISLLKSTHQIWKLIPFKPSFYDVDTILKGSILNMPTWFQPFHIPQTFDLLESIRV